MPEILRTTSKRCIIIKVHNSESGDSQEWGNSRGARGTKAKDMNTEQTPCSETGSSGMRRVQRHLRPRTGDIGTGQRPCCNTHCPCFLEKCWITVSQGCTYAEDAAGPLLHYNIIIINYHCEAPLPRWAIKKITEDRMRSSLKIT